MAALQGESREAGLRGGVASAHAWRTVRRCTRCRRANSLIEAPLTSVSSDTFKLLHSRSLLHPLDLQLVFGRTGQNLVRGRRVEGGAKSTRHNGPNCALNGAT